MYTVADFKCLCTHTNLFHVKLDLFLIIKKVMSHTRIWFILFLDSKICRLAFAPRKDTLFYLLNNKWKVKKKLLLIAKIYLKCVLPVTIELQKQVI